MTSNEQPKPRNFWGRMKSRWGVSNWGVAAIFVAFSLAGSTVLRVTGPIMNFVLPDGAPRWLWWMARILIIVPVYQVLLLMYGTILGQFRFFWEKERKMAQWFVRLVTPGSKRASEA